MPLWSACTTCLHISRRRCLWMVDFADEPCGGARAPGAGPVGIHRWRLRDRWARSGTLSASKRRNKIARYARELDSGEYGLQLLQKLPGDRNVKLWPPLVQRLLERQRSLRQRLSHYLFTQINKSVIEQVMAVLGEPLTRLQW